MQTEASPLERALIDIMFKFYEFKHDVQRSSGGEEDAACRGHHDSSLRKNERKR